MYAQYDHKNAKHFFLLFHEIFPIQMSGNILYT